MSASSTALAVCSDETDNLREGISPVENRPTSRDGAQVLKQPAAANKKRGRPQGSKNKAKPHTPGEENAGPATKRPRGQSKGTKNKSQAAAEEPSKGGSPKSGGRGRPKGSKDRPKAAGDEGNRRKNCGRPAGSKDKVKKPLPPPGAHVARKNCGRPKGSLDKAPRRRKGSQGVDL